MSKNNIILSVVLSLIFIVSSYLSIHQLVGFWTPSIIMLVGIVLICVLIARNVKKDNNGYASFGTLVKSFTIAIAIATIISLIASVTQISLLDNIQKEAIIDKTIEAQIEMYSGFGLSNEQLAEMEDSLEEKMVDVFKPSTYILNGLAQLIFYILISLIPAAILKKNPPLEVG